MRTTIRSKHNPLSINQLQCAVLAIGNGFVTC